MSNIATDLEQEVLKAVFEGEVSFLPVDNVYVALHTEDPGNDADAGEVDADDYEREQTDPSIWEVDEESGGPSDVTNVDEVRFTTAESDWGEITHVSAWDSETDGNALFQGELNEPRNIEEGDRFVFPEDDFDADLT